MLRWCNLGLIAMVASGSACHHLFRAILKASNQLHVQVLGSFEAVEYPAKLAIANAEFRNIFYGVARSNVLSEEPT